MARRKILPEMRALKLLWIVVAVPVASGQAEAAQAFPKHWGNPPAIQTRDYRPLPGGYGFGSSTMARWIQQNLDRDATGGAKTAGIAVGNGATATGEMREGRSVILILEGPPADGAKHDYAVSVRFIHKSGAPEHIIKAAPMKTKSSPENETRWQAQFTPAKPGEWIYRATFTEQMRGATSKGDGPVLVDHRRSGSFRISAATAKEP